MMIRPCICIPTFSNPKTLQEVLEDCIKNTDFPIIVVDQGSKEPIQNSLNSKIIKDSLNENRLSIVRSKRSRGKGFAIQTAFQYAVKMAYTHMVTFDGNRQYQADVIQPLMEKTVKTPWNLIIGDRNLSGKDTPPNSKLVRRLSNFWVKYETKTKIIDSQSGLRVYPLFFVQGMKFWTKGINFEIEVLIRLLWKKVEVTEIPISTNDSLKEKKITRFKNFGNSVKITLLNFWLVLLSLIKEHRSPKEASLALGIGVFVGCTPFFGFHTPIALLLSLVFRLNTLFLWIGTQISIPPIAPFLAFASINIGLWVTGHTLLDRSNHWTLETGMEFFSFWILGSIILGSVLSIITMLCVYFISKRFLDDGKSPKTWQGKIRGGNFGHYFIKKLLRLGGLRTAFLFLYFIVPYFYIFAPRARRSSLEYWRTVKPDLSFFQIRGKVLKHFYRYGTLLLEQAYKNSGASDEVTVKSVGYENIQKFSHYPNGGILLGAHVGAWNMALSLLPEMDILNSFVFLQFESKGLTFNKAYSNQTSSQPFFFYINEKESPILDIYSFLKNKKIIGIMGDRPLGKDYELVPFFGKLAVFDKTPFLISAIAKAPMLITFGFWNGMRSYNFSASPIRHFEFTKEQNRQVQTYSWLKDYVISLEQNLQTNLDQWFNFFPFWSERPSSPLSIKTKKERHYLCPQLNI